MESVADEERKSAVRTVADKHVSKETDQINVESRTQIKVWIIQTDHVVFRTVQKSRCRETCSLPSPNLATEIDHKREVAAKTA